jgi:hypothetical protein
MDYLKIDYNNYNDYERLLSPSDPKLIQSNIIDFLVYLRDKGKSPNTISSYLASYQILLRHERYNFELEARKDE